MTSAMKRKVDSHIKSIQDTIIVAEWNHDIWWIYKSRDTRPKFIDAMNTYLAFFQTSIHAHFVAMIIVLYRLYETRHDTISFPQLLKALDSDHTLSDNARNRVRELIQETKPIWIKIGIIRSEVFAHLSNARDIEGSFKKADLKYGHFNDLIELSKTIINVITHDYARSTHAFNLSVKFDTKDLLTDLSSFCNQKNEKK
jgi:hypothetical protein